MHNTKSNFKLLRTSILVIVGVFLFSHPSITFAQYKYCCGDPNSPNLPNQSPYWYYDSAANNCKNIPIGTTANINCATGETCLSQGTREQGICYAGGGTPTPMLVTCGNLGQACCRRSIVEKGTCNYSNSIPDDENSASCSCIQRRATTAGPTCNPECLSGGFPGRGIPVGLNDSGGTEYLGNICQQNECNGCDKCNSNALTEYQQTLQNNEDSGAINLEGLIHNINNSSLLDFTGLISGNVNNTVSVYEAGAFMGVGNMIASLYRNPPASSAEYIADLGNSLGLARPAYAQGVGFTTMSAILPAWKAARNVAYVFFIIAFIVSGFAIMFRTKISPQAVITIQNALPKMIVSLILVTFSYAIAGLLIDLSYLLLYLAILAFGQTHWLTDIAAEQTKTSNMNFWGGFGAIYGGAVKGMFTSVAAMFDSMATGGPPTGGFVGGILTTIGGVLGALLFWIVALVIMFKLFFTLISCYVQVIMYIFIGPLLIAADALPNGKNGFKNWLTTLMGNIMVFPGVAFILMVGNVMSSKKNLADWNPPLFGDRSDLIGPMFGFGILMLAGKMPEIIKGLFKIKDAGYGSAIGQAMGPIRQPMGSLISSRAEMWEKSNNRTNISSNLAKILGGAIRGR